MILRKNDETKTYSDTIEIKRACNQDEAEVNNGYGECKYCIDRNEITPFFDYNARNDIDSKRCISECPENQVSYNNICFDSCLNASNFVTENINHYIPINNGSCFAFKLEKITENVGCLNNQELNLTFNLNETIEPEYFSEIDIGGYKNLLCESSVNSIFTCIFNFSDLKEDKNYTVTFKLNNGYVISTEQIVYITLKSAQEYCKNRDRYFNTEKNYNFCQCKTNKFDENNECVKKCTSEFYDEEKNCINECNGYKLKEEVNFTSHKKCLQSCPTGYAVDDENLMCTCNKYIIGDSCSNMGDSNPLKSIQPLFVQAIQDADINFTFNSELDSNTHRIDIIRLRNQNNEIDGYNCTSIDEYTINCLFNLTSITQDSILEI